MQVSPLRGTLLGVRGYALHRLFHAGRASLPALLLVLFVHGDVALICYLRQDRGHLEQNRKVKQAQKVNRATVTLKTCRNSSAKRCIKGTDPRILL